ncbi:MAG TPA: hypothetical protein VIK42_02725 [Bacteroidales bacterium]
MKKIHFLFLFILTLIVSTQANHGQNRFVEPVKGPFVKNDTLFFYKQLYVVDHDTCVNAEMVTKCPPSKHKWLQLSTEQVKS